MKFGRLSYKNRQRAIIAGLAAAVIGIAVAAWKTDIVYEIYLFQQEAQSLQGRLNKERDQSTVHLEGIPQQQPVVVNVQAPEPTQPIPGVTGQGIDDPLETYFTILIAREAAGDLTAEEQDCLDKYLGYKALQAAGDDPDIQVRRLELLGEVLQCVGG